MGAANEPSRFLRTPRRLSDPRSAGNGTDMVDLEPADLMSHMQHDVRENKDALRRSRCFGSVIGRRDAEHIALRIGHHRPVESGDFVILDSRPTEFDDSLGEGSGIG